jgi:hypothetical protein
MRHSIIPPYLLQHIADSSPDRSDSCQRTLLLDDQIRSTRPAQDGNLRAAPVVEGVTDTPQRTIYDAQNTEDLPGTPARSAGDPATGDAAVDEAYESSGQAWELFSGVFGREGVDGNGTPMSVTVHYGQDYQNAFWDGQQLVFGDGDGEIFDRFTKPMDVMAHEFTHGVTEHTAGLTYQGQSGALNESVSDVFAAMAKQQAGNQTAEEADWLIGEGLFMPSVKATALRSMKEPGTAYDDPRLGKDPQVGSMEDYVDTSEDNGGVHINSGIPNRAFYLAATKIGGKSWEQAGPVWYQALTGGEVGPDTDFAGFASATVNAAHELYADSPEIGQKVTEAWTEVGVLGGGQETEPAPSQEQEQSRIFGVQRSGGITGIRQSARVDLDSDPDGQRLSGLLNQVDFSGLQAAQTSTRPLPDRFVYDVEYGQQRATVGEKNLTPELNEAIKIAFAKKGPQSAPGDPGVGRDHGRPGRGGPGLGGPGGGRGLGR